MANSLPHVSIITLNWNSWRDTIECLESVLKLQYPNFNVILVDNHSSDGSISMIQTWAQGNLQSEISTNFPEIIYPLVVKPLDVLSVPVKARKTDFTAFKDIKPKILFLLNDENAGFAIANNIAIDLAFKIYQSQYVFLLNNDTVIAPNSLDEIIFVMQNDPSIGASQATIYYYHQPAIIANAGGLILPWGQTKYYKKISSQKIQEVAFLNCCALCIRREIIERQGALTEDFFYGEEDFEFSMRLKLLKIKKVCVTQSEVYHKIGISSHEFMDRQTDKKVLLFAINRIVDMKKYLPPIVWRIWKIFALFYFFILLFGQYRESFGKSCQVIDTARKISTSLEKVDKNVVQSILT